MDNTIFDCKRLHGELHRVAWGVACGVAWSCMDLHEGHMEVHVCTLHAPLPRAPTKSSKSLLYVRALRVLGPMAVMELFSARPLSSTTRLAACLRSFLDLTSSPWASPWALEPGSRQENVLMPVRKNSMPDSLRARA